MTGAAIDLFTRAGARISACGLYRYRLSRTWNAQPPLAIIMLNPSTADGLKDGATIRRCIGFARRAGWGGIEVGNRFAFRATNPAALERAADPEGPENEAELRFLVRAALAAGSDILCAWGGSGPRDVCALLRLFREERVVHLLRCLGVTQHGQPRHPLYVAADQPMEPWLQPRESARPSRSGT